MTAISLSCAAPVLAVPAGEEYLPQVPTATGDKPVNESSDAGGTSAAEGRRRERRSKTLDDAPSFADALENGRVSAEHVDALANATTGLAERVPGRG